MKIILVGASGVVGGAIARELGVRHEIIRAGRNGADVRVDMTDYASVQTMYDHVGNVDAVVSAAGHLHFGPLIDMTPAQHAEGLANKLMGHTAQGMGLHSRRGMETLLHRSLSEQDL